MSLDPEIRDNEEAKRYELEVDGETAVVIYNPVAGGRLITETIVPVPLEGRGIASRMAKHVLADLKAKDLLILPTCPFFSSYLKKYPEYADQVHPTYRAMLGL